MPAIAGAATPAGSNLIWEPSCRTSGRSVMTSESTANLAQRMQRAVVAHQRGELESAEREYRAVLVSAPEHPDATHFLGLALHQRGRSDEALPLLQRALTLAPGSHLYRGNLAGVLEQLGRSAEA